MKDAAEAMNVGKSTMDKWVRQLKQERSGGSYDASPMTSEQRRIRELERQVKRLETEKDILKKGMVDSTDQCNIMHTGNYRGFQNAAASIKDQRADLPAEAGAMGSMEERAVA